MAEAGGADEAQIRRAGRWNSEKMEGCYLTTLPKKCMRSLAGFPTKPGSYWLPRAVITPSEALRNLVFPEIDRAERQLDSSKTRELAGRAFLRCLRDLRVIFLQDSVMMRAKYPSHSMWNHPLFNTTEYQEFSRDMQSKIPSLEIPTSRTLDTVVPHLSSALKDGFAALHGRMDELVSEMKKSQQSLTAFTQQAFVLTPVTNMPALDENEAPQEPHAPPATPTDTEQPIPAVKLSRALTTVVDVWTEYSQGIAGSASISEMERKFGAKWRQSAKETRFFFRRKMYYKAIERLAALHSIPPEEVASRLELQRVASGKHLNSFCECLAQVTL